MTHFLWDHCLLYPQLLLSSFFLFLTKSIRPIKQINKKITKYTTIYSYLSYLDVKIQNHFSSFLNSYCHDFLSPSPSSWRRTWRKWFCRSLFDFNFSLYSSSANTLTSMIFLFFSVNCEPWPNRSRRRRESFLVNQLHRILSLKVCI